jgi:hypothetical protein
VDVSIVVLTWEDVERTRACVKSMPAGAEVVVVDNGSSTQIRDGVRAMCDELGAIYVQSGANLGYARGMNLGVRHSSKANLILANNDIVVHGDAVCILLAALADPSVGVAFPGVVDPAGIAETSGGRFLTIRLGVAHATGLSLLAASLRVVAPPERADWLTGPFVALRRRTFDQIGGVDESTFFYSEDLRLCWAIRQLGLRLAYVPDAVVSHEANATSGRRWSAEEISRRQMREFVRASRQLGGWRGGLASSAYVAGVLMRAAVGPSSARRAVARGAVEGLRAR